VLAWLSMLLCCWLGGRKGIRPVKNWVVGVQLPLTVSCFNKIQIGFTFLVLAYPSSRRKRAIEQTCVLICFCLLVQLYFFLHSLVTIHLLSVMCCIVSQLCVFLYINQGRCSCEHDNMSDIRLGQGWSCVFFSAECCWKPAADGEYRVQTVYSQFSNVGNWLVTDKMQWMIVGLTVTILLLCQIKHSPVCLF